MDDDMDFDSAAKPSRDVKRGRRAGVSKAMNPPDAPAFESPADSPQPSRSQPARDPDEGGPPPKPNRVSGWGEENPRKSRKLGEGFDFDDERLRPHSPDKDEDSDADIPVIPDLEDQQDEDMNTKIAIAPNVAVNRVATYRELDHDLQKQAAFLTLDNEIDLKLLTKSLSADADLFEEDRPWDWDRLFTEVTSELFTQTEQTEENDFGDQVLP
ncbi:intraflagellar transport protein 43 homolog [Ostrea edulis]|uniref:intraflagellar transport protein 43 homolog n=1 Tax=Ostrea edulis TaxID=37623 RepID=UPI0020963585|nr:intraflagellar transport protein 43 homolog [Ostrea edulis]XP_056020901.1 intraflagellar transport protein 43 homolog [Ostrea edulis]XP_056020902.1 intraflagellar transport protein 43 homolog [Ostrea edulis]